MALAPGRYLNCWFKVQLWGVLDPSFCRIGDNEDIAFLETQGHFQNSANSFVHVREQFSFGGILQTLGPLQLLQVACAEKGVVPVEDYY